MIELITRYGLLMVFGNVLAEQIGLPLPAMPTLIVAGALGADGRFSLPALFATAVFASSIADFAWYLAGRLYGHRVIRLLCSVSLSPDSCVRQTEVRFSRWGGLTLVIVKFIPGLSTIAPPLAGAMRLGWPSFFVLNGLGAALWVGVSLAAGLIFHAQINQLLDLLQDLGTTAFELLAVVLAGYVALKWYQRQRFIRQLRIARIGPLDLYQQLAEEARPVIVDLRSSVIRSEDPRHIPGALFMDLADLDRHLDQLPGDRDIVFYCSCPNEASAAAAARKLMQLGYTRVRPLQGGLEAWVKAGLEVHVAGTIPAAPALGTDAGLAAPMPPGFS